MRTRSVRSVVYLGAGLGLIVAIFAAVEFFDASIRVACTVNSWVSCAAVDNSGLTSTLWVPDWLWGIGGFVVILIVASLAEQRPDDPRRAYALLAVTTGGVALSVYLLYVELALIHALCLVCVAAYLFGGVAWGGAIALVRRAPSDTEEDDETADESDAVE
jgi:uncharacterized membrane protein